MPQKEKTGPKSLEEMTGEKTTMIKILVTEPQKEHVSNQGISVAAYIRRLIDIDMAMKDVGVDPEKMNVEVLRGLEIIMQSLQNNPPIN
jgi:hypothetical protein